MTLNDDKNIEPDLNLSTYRMITTRRLLEQYHIDLKEDALEYTLTTPNTFYSRLLRIPLKNILNGIILQQIKDYQLYVQKLFIDYLMAGENNKDEEAGGNYVREELETARLKLVEYNEGFSAVEQDHTRLIGYSQLALLKHATEWKDKIHKLVISNLKQFTKQMTIEFVSDILETILIAYPLEESTDFNTQSVEQILQEKGGALTESDRHIFIKLLQEISRFAIQSEQPLHEFWDQVLEMTQRLREYRSLFQEHVVTVTGLIQQLGEYRLDENKTKKNREDLSFDPSIGD